MYREYPLFSKYKVLALFLINCFIFLIVFGFFEMALRIVKVGYGSAPLEGSVMLHHEHPKNYSFLVHDVGGEFQENAFVHYDAEGLRFNPGTAKNDEDLPVFSFVGDSFVEATQVAWENSFVGILENDLIDRGKVKNFGVSAYSPVLSYLQWDRIGKKYQPGYVVHLLYSNDPREDKGYFEKAEFSEQGEIVCVEGVNTKMANLLRRSYVVRYLRKMWLHLEYNRKYKEQDVVKSESNKLLEESPELTALTEKYILKLKEEVEEASGKYILSAVPSKYRHIGAVETEQAEFAQKVEEWAFENNILYIDLVEPFKNAASKNEELFYKKDIHFNLAGHEVVAKTILEFFDEEIAMQ
ncbi:MAG: SGNH/GDSL hydrolase family protein [Bacteroidota bacterium]